MKFQFLLHGFCFCILCFPGWVQTAPAASPPVTGTRQPRENDRMAAPLAEMMFYESAEQAVEDGYARIIPDNEDDKDPDNRQPEAEEKPEAGK
jgi:hypothetical protein